MDSVAQLLTTKAKAKGNLHCVNSGGQQFRQGSRRADCSRGKGASTESHEVHLARTWVLPSSFFVVARDHLASIRDRRFTILT